MSREAQVSGGHERYPGEDYFREHSPAIRKAKEDWEQAKSNAEVFHSGCKLGWRNWMPSKEEMKEISPEVKPDSDEWWRRVAQGLAAKLAAQPDLASLQSRVKEAEKLIALWRDEVPPECTCGPISSADQRSYFHKGDCPNFSWKRKHFQCDAVTQRKCADELEAALRGDKVEKGVGG